MSNNNPINDKKKSLLAYKQKILEDMQYYDKRIEEFRANHRSNCYYDDSDSSDSEDYFPNVADIGPGVSELKQQQELLKTCLQATQELTNLTVLQSEINVLVQDPQFQGETGVTEPGTWHEVTAECRIDLVPFTISFYMHTSNRKFGSTSYRGLQLSLVKAAHAVELDKSVLPTLKRPSDAVEVVRSYSVGYRSRRTTLARLANKYASSLFMEPHPEGGFILKCANLLEILWRLENKWSPVAPFHHRMKFDLEYMDESYIKVITHSHKQLLDPALQTDERTLLLSKIINTCLEARGPVDSESDVESKQTDARTETELKSKDSEVMAPPKSLPKKTKKIVAKDKKQIEDVPKDKSAPQKRSIQDENEGGRVKKAKTGPDSTSGDRHNLQNKEKNGEKKNDDTNKKDKKSGSEGVKKNSRENPDTAKNKPNSDKSKQNKKKEPQNNHIEVDNNDNVNENNINTANIAKKRKNKDNITEISKINKKDNKQLRKTNSNEELKRKNTETVESDLKKVKSSSDINKTNVRNLNNKITDIVTNKVKSKATDKGKEKKNNVVGTKQAGNIEVTNNLEIEKPKNNKNDEVPSKKIDRKSKMSIANDKKFDLITKKVGNIENNKNVEKVKTKNLDNQQTKSVATLKNVKENKKAAIVADKQEGEKHANKNIKKNTEQVPKNIESQNTNKPIKAVTNKNSVNTKALETVKTFTEKNAKIITTKNKISNVNKPVTGKIIKEKPTEVSDKPEKIGNSSSTPKNGINNKKLPKITTKSIRNIIHKSPNPKKVVKIHNSQKSSNPKISSGNIQMFSGNSEKENGGKKSKIPQKTLLNSDKILKANILRISPRRLPSKFKSISKETNPKQVTKTTNIPRFVKKPAPRVSK